MSRPKTKVRSKKLSAIEVDRLKKMVYYIHKIMVSRAFILVWDALFFFIMSYSGRINKRGEEEICIKSWMFKRSLS